MGKATKKKSAQRANAPRSSDFDLDTAFSKWVQDNAELMKLFDDAAPSGKRMLFAQAEFYRVVTRKILDGYLTRKKAGRKAEWTPTALAYLLLTYDELVRRNPRKKKLAIQDEIAALIKGDNKKAKISWETVGNKLVEARKLRRQGKLPEVFVKENASPK